MLKIRVFAPGDWNEETEEFMEDREYELRLEHSLYTVSLWEAIWHEPFIGTVKNNAQASSYLRCMTINEVPEEAYLYITTEQMDQINDYIKDSHSAALPWEDELDDDDRPEGASRAKVPTNIIVAENLYGYMFDLGIPLEWEHRHFNRLLKLIRVMQKSREPEKKKSAAQRAAEMRALNKMRQKKYNTKG